MHSWPTLAQRSGGPVLHTTAVLSLGREAAGNCRLHEGRLLMGGSDSSSGGRLVVSGGDFGGSRGCGHSHALRGGANATCTASALATCPVGRT